MGLEKVNGVLKLTADTKKRLLAGEKDIKTINHSVKVLKELGLDVSEIASKVEWAEKVRATLLKEFG